MSKAILVLNCGSSSLKYEVYDMPSRRSLGKGQVERIGLAEGKVAQSGGPAPYEWVGDIPNHGAALGRVMEALSHREHGIVGAISDIQAVGHRVVHGGEHYSASVVIDAEVEAAIEKNIELAPLHNPANLTGIREAGAALPGVPQVAVFDTAFHQTLAPSAYLYGIPKELYDKYRIRRYGFHGTSHRYVANEALKLVHRSWENTNAISCHLGNGASITAIQKGRSVDTSMGFTPLEGLMMGTRSGDIDPAIIFYLMDRGFTADELNTLLNKKSGLKGLSGISSDMRDVEAAAEAGDVNARQALDVYAHRIRKYIGAYAANMVKVDILVFTGGIGQFAWKMREKICHRMQNIGVVIDEEKNKRVGSEPGVISMDYSPTEILVIPTNEELQIAIDTHEIVFGD